METPYGDDPIIYTITTRTGDDAVMRSVWANSWTFIATNDDGTFTYEAVTCREATHHFEHELNQNDDVVSYRETTEE